MGVGESRHFAYNALVISQSANKALEFLFLQAIFVFIVLAVEFLDLVFLPLVKFVLGVLPELVLVLLLLRRHRDAHVCLLIVVL